MYYNQPRYFGDYNGDGEIDLIENYFKYNFVHLNTGQKFEI